MTLGESATSTARDVMANVWSHAYTREQAAFPLPWVAATKYWPPVNRVDNVYGDRNVVCTCAPLAAYAQAAEYGSAEGLYYWAMMLAFGVEKGDVDCGIDNVAEVRQSSVLCV